MYKVVLYSEDSRSGESIEIKLKNAKDVKTNNEGVLKFEDGEGKTIAEFSKESWQYWVKVDEKT